MSYHVVWLYTTSNEDLETWAANLLIDPRILSIEHTFPALTAIALVEGEYDPPDVVGLEPCGSYLYIIEGNCRLTSTDTVLYETVVPSHVGFERPEPQGPRRFYRNDPRNDLGLLGHGSRIPLYNHENPRENIPYWTNSDLSGNRAGTFPPRWMATILENTLEFARILAHGYSQEVYIRPEDTEGEPDDQENADTPRNQPSPPKPPSRYDRIAKED